MTDQTIAEYRFDYKRVVREAVHESEIRILKELKPIHDHIASSKIKDIEATADRKRLNTRVKALEDKWHPSAVATGTVIFILTIYGGLKTWIHAWLEKH